MTLIGAHVFKVRESNFLLSVIAMSCKFFRFPIMFMHLLIARHCWLPASPHAQRCPAFQDADKGIFCTENWCRKHCPMQRKPLDRKSRSAAPQKACGQSATRRFLAGGSSADQKSRSAAHFWPRTEYADTYRLVMNYPSDSWGDAKRGFWPNLEDMAGKRPCLLHPMRASPASGALAVATVHSTAAARRTCGDPAPAFAARRPPQAQKTRIKDELRVGMKRPHERKR